MDVVFKDVHVSGYMTLQQVIDRQLDRLDRLLCSDRPGPVSRVSEYTDSSSRFEVLCTELVSHGWEMEVRDNVSFVSKFVYETSNYIHFYGRLISEDEASFQFIDYYRDKRNEMAVQTIPFSNLVDFIRMNNLLNPIEFVHQHHP
jgi:hypothetical protein